MEITSEEQLRQIVGHPSEMVAKKVASSLAQVHIDWLTATPMLFLATSDADGRVDVSPKGDPAGKVVHVIDETTIAIPERPGNRRVDGYVNILANPHVGTIMVIPGRADTLRVNGSARIVDDGDYFDDLAVRGRRPILAVEIDVEEVFFHCSKAFLRSDMWRPEKWQPDALPTPAKIFKTVMPSLDEAALEEEFKEENVREWLY
ncbi:MSMEG_1061 family FMN-dependent PPOX-type flavoprotein [Gordonia sp. CPCC 205515]|uniref:MSMEG_1061 family FMN-dependent PPOX-type flavoprotein n=1 Tax=Gordonia sp. CPCC 205515 TaxID=3140791 RepID=UPI003AF35957